MFINQVEIFFKSIHKVSKGIRKGDYNDSKSAQYINYYDHKIAEKMSNHGIAGEIRYENRQQRQETEKN